MTSRTVSATQKAFNLWGIILIVWAVYRATIGIHAPMIIDEFLLKPLLFSFPVIMYVSAHEHRTLARGLWLDLSTWRADVGFGLLVVAPLFVYFVSMIFNTGSMGADPVYYLLVSMAMALTEESLSRGFIARHIYEETGSFIQTLVQASLMHLFFRVPRLLSDPALFGDRLVYVAAAEITLSFVVTWVFLWRRSLLTAMVVRAGYTFVLLSLLG